MKFPFWPNQKGYRDIELGLQRCFEILARLDNPHLKLPPTIHFAGTNGKGSTLSFMRFILQEHDLKIHTYTSPHLVNFNERIILANQEISDDFLNDCLKKCQEACNQEPKLEPTYFEGITVAAFLAFSKIKADILLLETGMGGRLDATNVISKNLCAIITPISLDHQDFLGNSVQKIAYEKSCIIKEKCPVFVGKQSDEALKIIEEKAKEMGSEIKVFGKDFNVKINQDSWDLVDCNKTLLKDIPKPKNLIGSHQIENAALAIFTLISQNEAFVKQNRIKSATLAAKWPARLEKIESGRFFKQNNELYLDGSHNEAGANTILEFLKQNNSKKRILIFSMLQDKDCEGFLTKIKNEIDFLIAITIENEEKSRKNTEIQEICNKIGIKSTIADNLKDAFSKIQEKNTLTLICGSLYLAGNFLSENEK